MITLDSYVRLAKKKLINFVETMDNSYCLFLNPSIALLGRSERDRAESDWLPLNVS